MPAAAVIPAPIAYIKVVAVGLLSYHGSRSGKYFICMLLKSLGHGHSCFIVQVFHSELTKI